MRCRAYTQHRFGKSQRYAHPNFPVSFLEIALGNGYNRFVVRYVIAVLSGTVTRTGPWGVTSTPWPAAIHVSKSIIRQTFRNCKACEEIIVLYTTASPFPRKNSRWSGVHCCTPDFCSYTAKLGQHFITSEIRNIGQTSPEILWPHIGQFPYPAPH